MTEETKQLKRPPSLVKAQLKYYEKIKDTEHFKNKRKEYIEKTKERYKNDEEFRKKKREYQKKYYHKKKILSNNK